MCVCMCVLLWITCDVVVIGVVEPIHDKNPENLFRVFVFWFEFFFIHCKKHTLTKKAHIVSKQQEIRY